MAKTPVTKDTFDTPEKVHAAIDRVNSGACTDEDLRFVLHIADEYSLAIIGKRYTVRELTGVVHSAENLARARWGDSWRTKH